MDTSEPFRSFALFGIRLDSATLAQATTAAWEGALSRAGLRVMLVDMWTLLLGQREFDVWEALTAADYVFPIADDLLIRRASFHQGMAVIRPDLMLYDLLDAAARANRPVVILAPYAELESDVALVRRIWPQLQVTELSRGDEELYDPDSKLIGAINAIAPALLVLGGYSPWQEEFVHLHRDELEFGAALTMPILHTAMAAIGQRVGMPVTGIGRMRRKAAISRALKTTLRPAAEASAETVGTWLAGARQGISAALHPNQSAAVLGRLAAIEGPRRRSVAVRALPPGDAGESSSRWASASSLASPLARIGPPRLPLPALPPPSASGPSASAVRWPRPAAKNPGSAIDTALPAGTAPQTSEGAEGAAQADAALSGRSSSPFEPPPSENQRVVDASAPVSGDASGPEASSADVSGMHTQWLSPVERGPWSSGLRPVPSDAVRAVPDSAAEEPTEEYDTFVVEGDAEGESAATTGDTQAGQAPAEGARGDAAHDISRDATRMLEDGAAGPSAPAPSAPDQVGPTTLLRGRQRAAAGEPGPGKASAAAAAAMPEMDPETLRVLATIDDLPPTRQLSERTVEGLQRRGEVRAPGDASATDASSVARDGEAGAEGGAAPEAGARGTTKDTEKHGAAPGTTGESTESTETTESTEPRAYTRISRKYVVRRMPRHIGHQRGLPRR